MKGSTEAWLNHASEDLEAMRVMGSNSVLAGMVAFHAQQCLEKCLKAVLEEAVGSTPRIHDLVRLHELAIKHIALKVDIDVLRELSDLYIDVRYPSDFGLLSSGRPDIDDSSRFILFVEIVYRDIASSIEYPNLQ